MNLALNVNGLDVSAVFDDESVRTALLPLLRQLTALRRSMNRRLTVFLAAPPGAGKSTLAAFLEKLSRTEPDLVPLQAVGMDGFHFHQDYILSHTVLRDGVAQPMSRYKGSPDTFDVDKLNRALRTAEVFPVYDRRVHDVIEDAVAVTAPILLVEGNWLLLDAPGWRDLPRDFSIFIETAPSLLRDRLIDRKIRGGLSPEAAEAYYIRTDGPNVARCLTCRRPSDVTLKMIGDGQYVKGDSHK